MKTRIHLFLAVSLLTVVTTPLHAQIVADGSSLTLSNVTNAFPGDVIIGTNGSFTLLTLSDNALVGAGGDGIIGLNSNSKSNEVRLISPTAFFFISTNLSVGSNGAFNRLIISNGARVDDGNGALGNRPFSSNNSALVTGVGSVWSNSSSLLVGFNGVGNLLVISNGGRASSVEGFVGASGIASNNTVLVTDGGSKWNNQSGLIIGQFGRGCRMVVSNSAFVDNTVGTIGYGAVGSDSAFDHSDNCEVVVTGSGSVWSNRTSLTVGREGKSARLVVTNGGSVFSLGDVRLGENLSSTNNRIIVAGGTLRATNAAGTATLDLLRGTNQFNAGFIEADFLRIANALGLFEFNGGLLTTRGALITNGAPFVVGGPGNVPAIWDVRAGVSNYFLSSDLYIGSNSSLNQLVITNGALLNNSAGILGSRAGANSNLAMVAGMNSVWNNRADLDVGFSGAANQLVVTNGGVVRNNFGILGVNSGSSNNAVLVTGSGSVWTNANDVYVGRSGAGNQLLVSDGGLVRNNDGYLGVNTGSSSNLAVVTGLGSVWNNAGALFLGQDDQGNRLVVTNEGVVRSSSVFVGLNTGSSNSMAMVTGSGSRWTNTQNFYAGYSSARNQLIVTNGGTLLNSNGYLGFFASSSSNLALVTGAGSVWSNSSTLIVGQNGPGNKLLIINGGLAQSLISQIGNAASSNNDVVVTDPGSLWSQSILELGNGGAANRMLVTNGAFVNSPFSYFGFQSPSKDNEAVVTGPDSSWNCGEFQLGYSGSSNRLVITNAGVVFSSSFAILGANASSTNNRLTVAGGTLKVTNSIGTAFLDVRRGTTVLNAGLIDVDILRMTNSAGSFEFNGGLLVTRGAFITNIVPFAVGIAGTNPAVWDVRAGVSNHILTVPLVLGQSPSFNQLLVTNGALFTSAGGFVGLNLGSHSNAAIVAGSGSRWAMSSLLELGSSGSFNSLVVSNGGSVSNTFGTLGGIGGNNVALVTGAGSLWTNFASLGIGNVGASNQLLVTDGGTVKAPSAGVCGPASSNNLVLVTGSNALWHIVDALFFGSDGPGNQLVVSNGGRVWDMTGNLGNASTGSNNLALVTGSGSEWTNVTLTVGGSGRGNQLIVNNGGAVRSATTFLGFEAAGSNNLVLVTDSGSAFSGDAYVGFNGARNQLVVSNSAVAQGSYGALGSFGSSSNNLATVTGSGSVWSNGLELSVGQSGGGNQLVVSNGATVAAGVGFIGQNTNANRNAAIVTDPGTRWLLASNLYVGSNGAFSQLIITNGARLENGLGYLGTGASSSNNVAVVTGSGSVWSNANQLFVGHFGAGNQLVVSNGARVDSNLGFLGRNPPSSSNTVLVTGAGSIWSNRVSIFVGDTSSGNRLVVSNGAVVSTEGVIVGHESSSTNNLVLMDGGTMRVTNVIGAGVLDVRRGTNVLNAGLIEVDQLLLTNSAGLFEFNGGTLSVKSSRVTVGNPLRIGNGVSPATWLLAGNGTHDFSGTLGLLVSSNATFTGNGMLIGQLLVQNGGMVVPGTSVGKIVLSNSPSLQGAVIMEISKNGATLTNDQVQVSAPLTYGGSLVVSNIGPSALAAGDRFPLFSASSYAGGFTNIILPPLSAGLGWTNKLLVDGSIEVVAGPKFTSISLSGTNLIITGTGGPANALYAVVTATNVATPSSNWVSLVTNQLDSGGGFSFTNGIPPGEPQRYFRIRTP